MSVPAHACPRFCLDGLWLRRLLAPAILAALCPSAAAARAWDLGAGLETTYDDNILDYSNRDLFTFQYRLNPPRYALQTTDDLLFAPYVEMYWEPARRSNGVRARFQVTRYANNPIRNNLHFLLQGHLLLHRGWRLTLTGVHVPTYYMRRYIEDELVVPYPGLPRYLDAKYRQDEVAAAVEWTPARSWRAQVEYSYGRRDFLQAFPERDEDRHYVTLSLRPPRIAHVMVHARGLYGRVLARGQDGDEIDGRPDDPDVSTRNFGGGLTLDWMARRQVPSLSFQQTLDYESRRYTTQNMLDTERFGRSKHETDLAWGLTLGWSRGWSVEASYAIGVEHLTGPLSPTQTFTDASNYNRHGVSLALRWTSRY